MQGVVEGRLLMMVVSVINLSLDIEKKLVSYDSCCIYKLVIEPESNFLFGIASLTSNDNLRRSTHHEPSSGTWEAYPPADAYTCKYVRRSIYSSGLYGHTHYGNLWGLKYNYNLKLRAKAEFDDFFVFNTTYFVYIKDQELYEYRRGWES